MTGSEAKVLIVPVGAVSPGIPGVAGVVVAGTEAAAVGAAVDRLRAGGVRAGGFVGSPDDPAAMEMAAELFPGAEVVVAKGRV